MMMPMSARLRSKWARHLVSARHWPAGGNRAAQGGVMRERNVMPDEGFTELAGPRVALRRFHPDDVATFAAYRSAEQVARFQSWDAPYPREEGERFIRELAKEHPDTPGQWFQFAVA